MNKIWIYFLIFIDRLAFYLKSILRIIIFKPSLNPEPSEKLATSTQNNFVSIVITCKSIIGIVFFNFQKKINIEYKEKTLYVTKNLKTMGGG